MSQNKTVVPGLEPEAYAGGGAPAGGNSNFYARGANQVQNGTVVPGMMNSPIPDPTVASQPKKVLNTGKPTVGFLYSVSRTPLGEYWPLQMGRNTIGQSFESDIMLLEGTVSQNHAVIITRAGKNGIIAAIKDTESTNGTLINGEPIDFEATECHNGDVITIGNNYQFLFILIDAASIGLAPNKDFIPVDAMQPEEEPLDDAPSFENETGIPAGGFTPYNDGTASWGAPAGSTVGLDGSKTSDGHGGTVPM